MPRKFLEQVVRPNLAESAAVIDDLRLAVNSALAADALVAHIFWWCKHYYSRSNNRTNRPLEKNRLFSNAAFRYALLKN